MMQDKEKVVTVSVNLQGLAHEIGAKLAELAHEPLAFVLVVSVGKSAQYVSNAHRPEGMALLETVLGAWHGGHSDIPAHYNPDLEP